MQFSKRIFPALLCALLLSGCVASKSQSKADLAIREDVLVKSQNYSGLIDLYRAALKENDEPEMRVKLAGYYYEMQDYKSSVYYLQPLMSKPDLDVYTLQVKNLIAMEDFPQALRVTDIMVRSFPSSAETYNLRGISLALSGNLSDGALALQQARDLYLQDDIAINNIAMISILNHQYKDAVDLLLPQYLQGRKQPQMLRNLVLALVQTGDLRYAHEIIKNEELSTSPDELMQALENIVPVKRGVI